MFLYNASMIKTRNASISNVCVCVRVLATMCACVCLFGKWFFSGGRGVEKYTSLSFIEHIAWIFLDVLCISLIGEYVRSMLHQNQLYIRVFPKVTHLFHCIVVAADFVCWHPSFCFVFEWARLLHCCTKPSNEDGCLGLRN